MQQKKDIILPRTYLIEVGDVARDLSQGLAVDVLRMAAQEEEEISY